MEITDLTKKGQITQVTTRLSAMRSRGNSKQQYKIDNDRLGVARSFENVLIFYEELLIIEFSRSFYNYLFYDVRNKEYCKFIYFIDNFC